MEMLVCDEPGANGSSQDSTRTTARRNMNETSATSDNIYEKERYSMDIQMGYIRMNNFMSAPVSGQVVNFIVTFHCSKCISNDSKYSSCMLQLLQSMYEGILKKRNKVWKWKFKWNDIIHNDYLILMQRTFSLILKDFWNSGLPKLEIKDNIVEM